MRKPLILILLLHFLVSCGPSQSSISTAISKTQTAFPTSTPLPTFTPTATINPCTSLGWDDIATYLKQFDVQIRNLIVGTSIKAYLTSLSNYQGKINGVTINACSEHARQTIISGIGNQIKGMEIALNNGKQEEGAMALFQGEVMIDDAKEELGTLGIVFNYP